MSSKDTVLTYIDETHKYYLGDKELISVTTLLSKHGLSTDYSNVDPNILEKKAQLGKNGHKEFEMYFKGEKSYDGLSLETQSGINILNNRFMLISTEQKVHNDWLAGTFDIYALDLHTKEFCLIDIKFTYNLNQKSVSWQLSLYKRLFGKQVDKLYVLWLNPATQIFELIEVQQVSDSNIDFLFECEQKGQIYKEDIVSKFDNYIAESNYFTEQIKLLEETLKQAKEKKAKVDEFLISGMKEYDMKTIENDFIKITLVEPKNRVSYNYPKLLENLGIEVSPDDLSKVEKVSVVKPYLKYTLKENE